MSITNRINYVSLQFPCPASLILQLMQFAAIIILSLNFVAATPLLPFLHFFFVSCLTVFLIVLFLSFSSIREIISSFNVFSPLFRLENFVICNVTSNWHIDWRLKDNVTMFPQSPCSLLTVRRVDKFPFQLFPFATQFLFVFLSSPISLLVSTLLFLTFPWRDSFLFQFPEFRWQFSNTN